MQIIVSKKNSHTVEVIESHHFRTIFNILFSTQKIFDKRDKTEERAKSWSEEIQYIEKGKGLLEQRDTGRIKEPCIDIYSTFHI